MPFAPGVTDMRHAVFGQHFECEACTVCVMTEIEQREIIIVKPPALADEAWFDQ
jgi:hypothetical protein